MSRSSDWAAQDEQIRKNAWQDGYDYGRRESQFMPMKITSFKLPEDILDGLEQLAELDREPGLYPNTSKTLRRLIREEMERRGLQQTPPAADQAKRSKA